MQAPPDKLGSFYLGAVYDQAARERSDVSVNYDARDLTTHAVCIGMTGSGKTGLCVGLLEEAALDRVPAIIIDPKGDMTNLLLQFPEQRPDDYRPWVNPDDARRKDMDLDSFAQSTADLWSNGLADWGIGAERIRSLLETVDYTIFTPGSDAGVPVSMLGSLTAPQIDFATEGEAARERISGTVAALLGLLDISADPIQSRESILLANIFEHYWAQGEDMDLAKLITAIQNPPMRQVGVFDVDTFYPPKDRFDLAMAFNNLVASPAFQSWLQGEPLDVGRMLYDADGRPRHSIFYIAHLSDSERMFFVTLLLENMVTWMRSQSGTTSLRALLYFDEVFGFFPPVGEPSSKRPLLTLLKQARAFGLGCVLVTQNPVDLDYKGLTNAGTWFIGKLQAERDKDRVMAGLQGALAEAGGAAPPDYDKVITGLDSRVFLMHNVHADGPVVFHTRWVHSYLRGPMTRPQVRQLMEDHVPSAPAPAAAVATAPTAAATAPSTSPEVAQDPPAPQQPVEQAPDGFSLNRPGLPTDLTQVFLPIEVRDGEALRRLEADGARLDKVLAAQLVYEPAVFAAARVSYVDSKRGIDEQTEHMLLAPAPSGITGMDWGHAEELALSVRDLEREPARVDEMQGPYFAPAPEELNTDRELRGVANDLEDWLYYNKRLTITLHEELGVFQLPGEREREFNIRLQQAARERRDEDVDKLRAKVEKELERLQEKLEREQRELAEDKADLEARRGAEVIGIGESVLGYFLGRKSSRALSQAATKRRMTTKARLDVEESEEEIAELQAAIDERNEELEEAVEEVHVHYANLMDELTTDEIKPRRADVQIDLVALAWAPQWLIRFDDGLRERTATVAAYALPEL